MNHDATRIIIEASKRAIENVAGLVIFLMVFIGTAAADDMRDFKGTVESNTHYFIAESESGFYPGSEYQETIKISFHGNSIFIGSKQYQVIETEYDATTDQTVFYAARNGATFRIVFASASIEFQNLKLYPYYFEGANRRYVRYFINQIIEL